MCVIPSLAMVEADTCSHATSAIKRKKNQTKAALPPSLSVRLTVTHGSHHWHSHTGWNSPETTFPRKGILDRTHIMYVHRTMVTNSNSVAQRFCGSQVAKA